MPPSKTPRRNLMPSACCAADCEGRPALMSAPVTQLMGDFPMRPALVGNLVPMNYNVWMGAAADGSTSGLHHDFHDNFYCLLHGRKFVRHARPAALRARG